MKKVAIFALLIIATAFLASCKKQYEEPLPQPPTTYEKIKTALMEMETFESEAVVTYISNKGQNEYITIQQVKVSGKYKIEVIGPENMAGNITISNGETIYQFNKNIDGKVYIGTYDTKERSQILLTNFVKNYLENEASTSEINEEEGITILSANVLGNHPYIATQSLWVNNQTLKPIQLVIHDANGKTRIVVTYKTFEYNVPLEESLFQLQ